MEDKQFFLTPELADRLAAIDIGTNSIRLIIAQPLRDGRYRTLDDEKQTTRLGRHLGTTGRLDPESVEASITALRRMKQIADGYQASQIRVIATCAVREATDGAEFCRRAEQELGLTIEVISAEDEARLAFHSVARNFDLTGKNVLVADIGGGSTEMVLATGNVVESIYTAPLGAVRISDRWPECERASEFERMTKHIDRELRRYTHKPLVTPHLMIGSGGTFTTLADMVMARRGQQGLPIRGYEVTQADVRHLLDSLRKMSVRARRAVPGLSADRADIIVGGLAIIDRLMRRFRLNRLQVHSGGVRDGLLLTMLDSTLGRPTTEPHDRDADIERFAGACGVDRAHGRHVARLAGEIFTQIAEPCALVADDRLLLEAAARLQDVGYLIDYDQHHKHSYHLILNSRLAGFSPHDLELIANIARYHRGSKPKPKHANFRQLSAGDQERVRRLAAILRVAGGLDRSHSQQVQDVSVSLEGPEITLHIAAAALPEVDLWGARRRADFFESVFGHPLQVEWQAPLPACEDARESAVVND